MFILVERGRRSAGGRQLRLRRRVRCCAWRTLSGRKRVSARGIRRTPGTVCGSRLLVAPVKRVGPARPDPHALSPHVNHLGQRAGGARRPASETHPPSPAAVDSRRRGARKDSAERPAPSTRPASELPPPGSLAPPSGAPADPAAPLALPEYGHRSRAAPRLGRICSANALLPCSSPTESCALAGEKCRRSARGRCRPWPDIRTKVAEAVDSWIKPPTTRSPPSSGADLPGFFGPVD